MPYPSGESADLGNHGGTHETLAPPLPSHTAHWGTKYSTQQSERYPVKEKASFRAALLSDDGGGDDDDEEDSLADLRCKDRCLHASYHVFRIFMPDWTPLLMFFTLCLIVSLQGFTLASEGSEPAFKFYGLYLAFSLAVIIIFLTARVLWLYLLGQYLVIPTSKVCSSLASVLDPESIYLAFTIALYIFWQTCIEVGTSVDAKEGTHADKVNITILNFFNVVAGSQDRTRFAQTEIVLIIWASRNFILKIVMFYFLIGFLTNVNANLVKFLTLYSLIRKLNANWIRLTPVLNELANVPNPRGSLNEGEENMFPEYPRQGGGKSINAQTSISSRHSFNAANKQADRQRGSVAGMAGKDIATDLLFPSSTGVVEAPFEGLSGQQVQPQVQLNDHALHIVDELLTVEALAKESKATKSVASHTQIPESLHRLQSITRVSEKTRNRKKLKERYQVEFTGRVLPAIMQKRNIEETQTSGIANLLAIQYVQQNPVALFVRGTRVELYSKRVAKLVGQRLFEELIEFRNNVAPDDALTAEQLDMHVKQSVIQSVEMQTQNSSHFPMSTGLRQSVAFTSRTNSEITGEQPPYPPVVIDISGSQRPPEHPHINTLSNNLPPTMLQTEPRLTHSRPYSTLDDKDDINPETYENQGLNNSGSVPSHNQSSVLISSTPINLYSSHNGVDSIGLNEMPSYEASNYGIEKSMSQSNSSIYAINISGPDTSTVIEDNPSHTLDEQLSNLIPNPQSRSDPSHASPPPPVKQPTITSVLEEKGTLSKEPIEPVGPVVHLRRVHKRASTQLDDRTFLTSELFELFMGDEVDDFMKYADPGGRQKVSMKEFTRMIIDLYQFRKQLVSLVQSQEGIRKVFRRMMAIFLTFLAILVFLIVVGVSANTIIISGAASVSSITVALSFLYSGFIQSVMFVCFLNPYNVGDRVRIAQELLIVKGISTYFTEFVGVPLNKPCFWNHSTLYNMIVVNESRCRNAGLEIPIFVAYATSPAKYEALHKYVESYVDSNRDFVKGSCVCLMSEVIVGHYIKFTYWITCTESWHRWKSVFATRGRVWTAVVRQCQLLNISYQLPVQPISYDTMNEHDKRGNRASYMPSIQEGTHKYTGTGEGPGLVIHTTPIEDTRLKKRK